MKKLVWIEGSGKVWMFVFPQNAYVDSLMPRMMVLEDGDFRVFSLWEWSLHEWD